MRWLHSLKHVLISNDPSLFSKVYTIKQYLFIIPEKNTHLCFNKKELFLEALGSNRKKVHRKRKLI